MHWYKVALPGLTGVSKTQVEQRLDSMFGLIDDPDVAWDKLTASQWERLKGVVCEIQAVRNKTETPVTLKPGQRARVLPHPTDTWLFFDWSDSTPKAVGWKGRESRFIWRGNDDEETSAIGSMWSTSVDGKKKPMNTILTGPGRIVCGPSDASLANKGVIRVKILIVE